jgi:hypothetical protein
MKGYDFFTPDPGAWDSKDCNVCGDKMGVERNVDAATSFIEAQSGGKHLHDKFVCPNAGKDWHVQIIALLQESKNTSSSKLSQIYQKEIEQLRSTRKATKAVRL